MTAEIERLPHIYPPRHREFAYVIVAEPDSFVLCKVAVWLDNLAITTRTNAIPKAQ
jgi:hypothetical protein